MWSGGTEHKRPFDQILLITSVLVSGFVYGWGKKVRMANAKRDGTSRHNGVAHCVLTCKVTPSRGRWGEAVAAPETSVPIRRTLTYTHSAGPAAIKLPDLI